MYRRARTILRSSQSSLSPARTHPTRRFISTEPPHLRSRSWKSSALRWGVAIAGIYYYNTSPVFAEQPQNNLFNPNLEAIEDEDSPSLNILASRRRTPNKNAQNLQSAADSLSSENASTPVSNQSVAGDTISAPGSLAELEEESEGEGAFNPETGEINWDCPCLGGMAHGPCGPEFREAFSCFVFSKEEPKGMECIERFQSMRDCFQQHPEVYKDELMDDEEIDKELENERQELAQQIKERREKDLAEETGSQRRLLEESPPAPRPAKSEKKTQPSHPQKEPVPSAEPVQAKKDAPPKLESTQMKRSPGSSKAAQTAEENENIYEGQKSTTVVSPSPFPIRETADPVDELVPKAAHDARDAKA